MAKAKGKEKYQFDDLFRATTELEINAGGRSVKYYLRGLTSTEIDVRAKMSLLAARKMKRKLDDEESDEYKTEMLQVYEETDKQMFINALVDVMKPKFSREAVQKVVRMHYPEPPDEAEIVELINLEDEEDNIEDEVILERKKFVDKKIEAYRKEIEDKTVDQLRELYAVERVNRISNDAFTEEFHRQTVYFATYVDPARTKRLFKDADSTMDHGLFIRIRDEYYELDRWSSEQLKN